MADVTVTTGDVAIITASKKERGGTGGATLTAGQIIYQDGNKFKGAVNSSATLAAAKGILLTPTADNRRCTYAYENGTEIDIGATLTEGTWYCVSSTAGNIHPFADLASGEQLVWVGYGNSDGNLMMWIINDGEVKS